MVSSIKASNETIKTFKDGALAGKETFITPLIY